MAHLLPSSCCYSSSTCLPALLGRMTPTRASSIRRTTSSRLATLSHPTRDWSVSILVRSARCLALLLSSSSWMPNIRASTSHATIRGLHHLTTPLATVSPVGGSASETARSIRTTSPCSCGRSSGCLHTMPSIPHARGWAAFRQLRGYQTQRAGVGARCPGKTTNFFWTGLGWEVSAPMGKPWKMHPTLNTSLSSASALKIVLAG